MPAVPKTTPAIRMQIIDLVELRGMSCTKVGGWYGLHRGTVHNIVTGRWHNGAWRSWKGIKGKRKIA